MPSIELHFCQVKKSYVIENEITILIHSSSGLRYCVEFIIKHSFHLALSSRDLPDASAETDGSRGAREGQG